MSQTAIEAWPQAAGPQHNWTTKTRDTPPLRWSVEKNTNIRWRKTLPETGQSGIAIWGDRLFLTTMKPIDAETKPKKGSDIVLYCINTETGETLWETELTGDPAAQSIYAYGFSNSSSPTPITDGKHVWCWNASGQMGCWTVDGKRIWSRRWKPTLGRPFNKQYEPIKTGNTILNVEPLEPDHPDRREDAWNFLRGFDSLTGSLLWTEKRGLTHYNTPVMARLPSGGHGVLAGRGAHHETPEAPAGMTLTHIDGPRAGESIWTWDALPDGKAQVTQCWDEKYSYWLDETRTHLVVVDTTDGKEVKRIPWTKDASLTSYDKDTQRFHTEHHVDFHKLETPLTVFPAWHANISIYPHVFFQCFHFDGKRKGKMTHIGPKHCIARINVETDVVEYLELPFPIPRVANEINKNSELYYPDMTINSRGLDVAEDKRSGRSGWWWCFNGNVIAVNQYLYFTFMSGKVQVIDGRTKHFDETALTSFNDLGKFGETWSVNSPSYSNGRLYHRTMKELICIEE
ncbi:PQQ-binding-like beta-propeller repeat protein [Rhodopirellula sp.]|nr:PQQ-binding-like beta-propeller repeat protein [Rhodopirellula sp.]MDB4475099.1 PQQ-binding-like beta-propeller repeat protein [bacterium]